MNLPIYAKVDLTAGRWDPLLKTLYPWERFCAAMQEVGRKVT